MMEIINDPNLGAVAKGEFRAQSYDTDFAGVVSNISYLRWCEDLRLALSDELLPGWETGKYGHVLVVAETKIRYRRPVRLYDILIGTCHVSAIDGKSFTLACEFKRGEEVTTSSEHRCCLMDTTTGKAADLPKEITHSIP